MTSGHDINCYYMMKGLADLGVDVALATGTPAALQATAGFAPAFVTTLAEVPIRSSAQTRPLSWLQERYRSYWGVEARDIQAVSSLVDAWRPDVVVAFGLPALPYLAGAGSALRVWAMIDEWVYHHAVQVRLTDVASWVHARAAVVKGGYERAYRMLVDRVWVVSETDRRAARYLAGMPVADMVTNGVDADFYKPQGVAVQPESAVFWGSLIFEPNIDAMKWFCREVWPEVRRRSPNATFTMMGYQPTQEVESLAGRDGVSLHPNVPDIRPVVCGQSVVVLPFLSGGGIKNKLLEGAAMGRPILSTRYACRDLTFDGPPPLAMADSPAEWVDALVDLWNDTERSAALGRDARAWVARRYSWVTPARAALAGFEAGLAARRNGRS